MQDISRCHIDEVMQVDNHIPPPIFDMGNKTGNRDACIQSKCYNGWVRFIGELELQTCKCGRDGRRTAVGNKEHYNL